MSRAAVALLALLVIAAVGIYTTEAALEDAGDPVLIDNETWTPDAGNVTVLNDSQQTGAFYDENVTVRDENNTVVDRGADYEWFAGNGTVKALTGGELAGDANASITYGYRQTTDEQRGFANLLGLLPNALGLGAPLVIVVLFLMALRGLA